MAFKIVAHRGATASTPENTLEAFRHALALGADAVELDVRLTRDKHAVVYHYFYLEEATSASGPIFQRTAEELRDINVVGPTHTFGGGHRIPRLDEVLTEFGGRMTLEIELKGPEPEAAAILGDLLKDHPQLGDTIEVTSFEPVLLLNLRRSCPNVATALLFPRSEDWMRLDVVAYAALQRAKLAQANAVHLHPSQLTAAVVTSIRSAGIDVHAWEVNDENALRLANDLGLPWICTDRPEQALTFRRSLQ